MLLDALRPSLVKFLDVSTIPIVLKHLIKFLSWSLYLQLLYTIYSTILRWIHIWVLHSRAEVALCSMHLLQKAHCILTSLSPREVVLRFRGRICIRGCELPWHLPVSLQVSLLRAVIPMEITLKTLWELNLFFLIGVLILHNLQPLIVIVLPR